MKPKYIQTTFSHKLIKHELKDLSTPYPYIEFKINIGLMNANFNFRKIHQSKNMYFHIPLDKFKCTYLKAVIILLYLYLFLL